MPTIDQLHTLLFDPDDALRARAVRDLAAKGPEGVDALATALRDERAAIRRQAAAALGQIASEESVRSLVPVLADKSEEVRRTVAWALKRIGVPSIELLITALHNGDSNIRAYAAFILGEIGNKWALDPLIYVLGDSAAVVRAQAARALGKLGQLYATDFLIEALADPENEVRDGVVWALDQLGEGARSNFEKALTGPDWVQRMNVAVVLVRKKASYIEELLARALKDKHTFVRQ